MTALGACTSYKPNVPLYEQLGLLPTPITVTADVFGLPYFSYKAVYQPLEVNRTVLNLSVKIQSTAGVSKDGSVCIYDKCTFTVKSRDNNEIDLTDISEENIEAVITEIFQSGAYRGQTL